MPNHVMHQVTISGDKKTIAKCKKQILNAYKDEKGIVRQFSFQTIIPRPESLNIESGSRVDEAIEYIKGGCKRLPEKWKKFYSDAAIKESIELGRQALMNIGAYGYKDWYDWSRNNWGTKWDCYEVSVSENETCIELSFQTAWNTPRPVFDTLAEQYPKLFIEVNYADEDFGSNCGIYSYSEGKLLAETLMDENFAYDLWGITPDDAEIPAF